MSKRKARKAVDADLRRLALMGLVERDEDGKWQLTSMGRVYVQGLNIVLPEDFR